MLNVQNLNIYYGRKQVIKEATFQIQPGEIVGLIGPNGAGKTTIMKTLLGLTKFTGTITFNHQPITANSHQPLQQVGALIENPAVYPFLSGRENLELYSQDTADMKRLINRLGMDTYIDEPAKAYSIGMKQKLGIALALLNKPKFVILDEPMNGLDIEATILIRQIIHEYAAQGTAFLISSHVLSELQKVMTSVIILNHHEIVMNVPIDQFKNAPVTQYQIKTLDNEAAAKILKANDIFYRRQNQSLFINIADIDQVQTILRHHQMMLRELVPVRKTFEQSIVEVLKEKLVDE
ncbi:ABC transporter, ATP-binding protein [Limosilactobacillus coleohominis 101-4-CHN]|uniref:ABC transporter, ATP-binding protein n=1 Tax=Limosilactobacillus coleohominis 101-4-CHN TaxID=575594 RepID=C7XVZ9_9LACO|nr:ATP-binding cassette domain-containing protein [Limosilactobacillus coleohominis]EEU30515.1 ABC transporter, ATP-binding protein [Limosilactobacillus coleohominis 101-4-CHN]